jgi:hypothetical protein
VREEKTVPFELRVVPGESLARIRGWGKEDFASTLAGMRTAAEDPRLLPNMPVLMDARDLDYLATPPEVSSFAAPEAMPALFGRHRLAILVRRGTQFGVARVFAAKAEAAGARVEVFVEEELALAWLRSPR